MPHSENNREQGEDTTAKIAGPPAPLSSVARQVAIFVFHADGVHTEPLSPGVPVLVGRSAPADVRIGDRSLSRVHARFVLGRGGRVLVTDLKSTNGTWQNGHPVETCELNTGGEVLLGNVVVRAGELGPEVRTNTLGDEQQFREMLEARLAESNKNGSVFSVVFMRAEGTLPSDDTHTIAPGDVSRWAHRVIAALGPNDRICRARRDAVLVLFSEHGARAATSIAHHVGAPKTHGEVAILSGVAAYPDAATRADELIDRARSAADLATMSAPIHIAREGAWQREVIAPGSGPVAASPAMRKTLDLAERAAQAPVPIILFGETGTGKEVVARFIHEQSPRKTRPMVSVNCAAIPAQLVESTLFGHERGAFTGANAQQRGVFESADGGTVFLDEVAELAPAAQAALLRVLETQRFFRVGGSREVHVDVRMIAATHRDLEKAAAEGQFRSDLYYRLATVTVPIAPLRERREDIAPLVDRFLTERAPHGGFVIEPDVYTTLAAYDWPGNVRELRNALERALVVAQRGRIETVDLPDRVRAAVDIDRATPEPALPTTQTPAVSTMTPPGDADLRSQLIAHERRLLVEALEGCGWNKTRAAERLGLPVRTLTYRMTVLGIQRKGR